MRARNHYKEYYCIFSDITIEGKVHYILKDALDVILNEIFLKYQKVSFQRKFFLFFQSIIPFWFCSQEAQR